MSETNERSVASDGSVATETPQTISPDWKNIANAWAALSERMQEDHGFAWAVHCNIACPFMDEGGRHEAANRAASRIMKVFFNFDVEQLDEWGAFPWAGGRAAEQ